MRCSIYFDQFTKGIHLKSSNSSITHLHSFSCFFHEKKSKACNRTWSTGSPTYFGSWEEDDGILTDLALLWRISKDFILQFLWIVSSIETPLASIITYHSVPRRQAASCVSWSLSMTRQPTTTAKWGQERPAVKCGHATLAAFTRNYNNLHHHWTFLGQGRNGWLLAVRVLVQPCGPLLQIWPCLCHSITDCPTVPRKKMMFMPFNKHFVDR